MTSGLKVEPSDVRSVPPDAIKTRSVFEMTDQLSAPFHGVSQKSVLVAALIAVVALLVFFKLLGPCHLQLRVDALRQLALSRCIGHLHRMVIGRLLFGAFLVAGSPRSRHCCTVFHRDGVSRPLPTHDRVAMPSIHSHDALGSSHPPKRPRVISLLTNGEASARRLPPRYVRE